MGGRHGEPLDAKNRLVLRALIGHESISVTIDHQVKLFKDSYANKHMLSEHHSRCFCLAFPHFNRKYFRHIDFLNTSSSVLRISTPQTHKP